MLFDYSFCSAEWAVGVKMIWEVIPTFATIGLIFGGSLCIFSLDIFRVVYLAKRLSISF